jgi:hypothetical protein
MDLKPARKGNMLHLLSERLAALADDEPTVAEAQHLAACPKCNAARRLHQDLLSAARNHGRREEQPLTEWNTLAARLSAEGLMVPAEARPRFLSRNVRRLALSAAAVALLAGGTAAGRISAGAPVVPLRLAAVGETSGAAETESAFSSKAEALNVYLAAQRDYQRAAAYLAANDESPRDDKRVYINRLAALEEMHAASLAALREAPNDPVLNNYYVSTLNARNATRQQMTRMVPVGQVVKSY